MLHHKNILLVFVFRSFTYHVPPYGSFNRTKVKRCKRDRNTGGEVMKSFVLLHQMDIFRQHLKDFHRRENAKCLITGNLLLVAQRICLIKSWHDTRPVVDGFITRNTIEKSGSNNLCPLWLVHMYRRRINFKFSTIKKFFIVPMVTGTLMGRMGPESILPINN